MTKRPKLDAKSLRAKAMMDRLATPGEIARLQDLARQTLEAVQSVQRAVTAPPAPVIYIARVRRQGIQFASWPPGRGAVRWTSKRDQATTFQAEESAKAAMRKLRARRGEMIELMRMLP